MKTENLNTDTKEKFGVYSQIFKNNTPNEDLIGIVAFIIFKMEEIKYYDNYTKSTGKKPSEKVLTQFRTKSKENQKIELYREEAQVIVKKYLESSLSNKAKEIEEFYQQSIVNGIKTQQKKKTWDFMYGALQSLVGSIFFVILTGLILFFVWSNKDSTKSIIREIFFQEAIYEPSDSLRNKN